MRKLFIVTVTLPVTSLMVALNEVTKTVNLFHFRMEYLFNFDGTFEIHDDIEVLKRMGLALGLDRSECSDEDIMKAKRVLPNALEMYIDQIGGRDVDWRAAFGDDVEDSYYHGGDGADDNVENVCYEVAGASALSLSGLSTSGDLTGISMSVEDLDMQTAIESLHNQSGQVMGEDNEDNGDDDTYCDDDDEDGLGD